MCSIGRGVHTGVEWSVPKIVDVRPGPTGPYWTEGPFTTRLLNGGPDRVTLLPNRIKFRRDGEWTEEPVADDD